MQRGALNAQIRHRRYCHHHRLQGVGTENLAFQLGAADYDAICGGGR